MKAFASPTTSVHPFKCSDFYKHVSKFTVTGLTNRLQFACLFAKLPQPRYSKGTFAVFESTCHLLLSV